jgi:hypothetical protein
MRALVMRAPADYSATLAEMGQKADVSARLSGKFDLIQYFATSEEQLNAVLANLAQHLEPAGMLWVCWAKRRSPLHSGLGESAVRRLGLAAGLVDVKLAAVSDDWSGLKFVYRLRDRN